MTDYKEEQDNEIEALESIYPDEIQVLSTEPLHCFQVSITSQIDKPEVDDPMCVIEFRYTATYPDEAPLMELKMHDGLDSNQAGELMTFLNEQVEENLGMVMVFTLVSAAQEKMLLMVEEAIQKEVLEKERLAEEKRKVEQKKFEGTCVSIETFLAWKDKFDAEMAEIKRRQGRVKKKAKGLTGKELFLTDHTLDDSDVKFIDEDGGEAVTVDESLFQDLDDLDLDEDES